MALNNWVGRPLNNIDDFNNEMNTSDDNPEDIEIRNMNNEIEFQSDSVCCLNECDTDAARRLCIFDISMKLVTTEHYDIGGTYIKHDDSQLKPDMWFYCTTSLCPQSNYILNIFVCHRKIGLVCVGVGQRNKIQKDVALSPEGDSICHLIFGDTLIWKTFRTREVDESHHLMSYCFSIQDLALLNKKTLCIPIQIINSPSIIDKGTLQRIKRNHNTALRSLFKRQENADLTLESASGKKYNVHRMLLAAHSSVLRNLIKNSEGDSLVLHIDDDQMEHLLGCIYQDSVNNITENNWSQLIELADKFKLVSLFQRTEYAILQNISITNAIDIAELSKKFNMYTIQKTVFNFIRNNPEVLNTDAWNNLNDVALTKTLCKEFYSK